MRSIAESAKTLMRLQRESGMMPAEFWAGVAHLASNMALLRTAVDLAKLNHPIQTIAPVGLAGAIQAAKPIEIEPETHE